MTHEQTFTWRDGEIPAAKIRDVRRLCYSWGTTSKLRRKDGVYSLTFTATSAGALDFARSMFEAAKTVASVNGGIDKIAAIMKR